MAKKQDPSGNDRQLHDWAMNILEDAVERRRSFEGEWWNNIAAYAGDLWSEFDPWTKKLTSTKPKPWKSRMPINLIQPVVRTEYAKILKNKPITDVLAKSNDRAHLNSAEVGDDMLNQYAEERFKLARVRRRMAWWTLITGFGFVFTDYNEKAMGEQEVLVGPDGQPIVDQRIIQAVQRHYRDKHKKPKVKRIPQGDLEIVAGGPFNLVWDMSKIFFEDAWWCIYTEVYDVDEVYNRWGTEIKGSDDALPGVIERRLLDKADLTGRMRLKKVTAQSLVKVHRLFIKPGHRYFPNGAEVVFTAGDGILERVEFPFSHGELPMATMGHIPFQVVQYPLSIVGQLRGPALELSKTESQLLDNRNLNGNPPWVLYHQNRIDGEIQNRPGTRITVHFQPGVPDPHPVELPEIPQYIKDLIPILKEHILEISGQGETSQGRVPAGARSGVAIAYLQEEDDTKLGPTVQEFEEAIERMSWHILSGFAQNYDVPRLVRFHKPHSDPEVMDFVGSMLDGVSGVRTQAGSALPRSKAAKQQYILDLFDRGLEKNPRRIREMLELSMGEPEDWEIDMQQAERENRLLQQGQGAPVMEWYNHPAHHYIHRNYMKSPEWDTLDPQAQQAFLQHDEEHTRFERQQQQAQLVQQSMGGGNGSPPPGQPTGPQPGQDQGDLKTQNGANTQQIPPQYSSPNDMGSVTDYTPQ